MNPDQTLGFLNHLHLHLIHVQYNDGVKRVLRPFLISAKVAFVRRMGQTTRLYGYES